MNSQGFFFEQVVSPFFLVWLILSLAFFLHVLHSAAALWLLEVAVMVDSSADRFWKAQCSGLGECAL